VRCFHRTTQREQTNIPSRTPILWLYSALLPLLSCIDVFEQIGADLVF
ncbi:putative membrane protein, partial [Vibrio parahaemolyticus VP2007-007]